MDVDQDAMAITLVSHSIAAQPPAKYQNNSFMNREVFLNQVAI